MKKIVFTLLAGFFTALLFAQDVKLNDSVIFINNKPIALYAKQLSNSPQYYNMEVYSFTDYVLIKAEVIKFNAPVIELEPFYYYEIIFPPTADTFAVYIDTKDFPLVLGKIISEYDLISNNELNKKNVAGFISQYYGGHALRTKIKSFEDHLNETRHFNEQVKRDRSKPVTIINDKIIMQDGVKIGLVIINENSQVTTIKTSLYNPANPLVPYSAAPYETINYTKERQILLSNGSKVYIASSYYDKMKFRNQKTETGKSLYEKSKVKNANNYSEYLLREVCFYIENYAL